ncbi:hypothetical protein CHS0354_037647 [Potamilus streckersoni]|uniref:C-type lectin domain-containing protein n=1 Tax=Potamilus streckersoni TaxID=2493646 RepID=A0AAE0T7T1_9BIVA|nr:hypothetical protein CHS0354_037647 [Potamilus streckersoni]
MKILTLLGLFVVLTTSPTTNCTPGQFKPPPIPYNFNVPVVISYPGFGSDFGYLALSLIVFVIMLLPLPTPTINRTPTPRPTPTLSPRPTPTPTPRPTPTPIPRCPSQYTLYSTNCGQFCYRYESEACAHWDEARIACRNEGADLWVPEVCSYPFFQEHVRKNKGTCLGIWIGVFRVQSLVNYMTVQGDRLEDNFQFWGKDEPDRSMPFEGNEDACVEMSRPLDYLMRDQICLNRFGFICKRSVSLDIS